MEIINLATMIETGTVGWVLGLGKANVQDEALELAFYNEVSGKANNAYHFHYLSTERLLVIKGGMLLKIDGQEKFIGELEMICIPPKVKHMVISYEPGTIALNLRNSKEGAIGHLAIDRE